MLINEVSRCTKLTKKAIEYYVLQGLLSPTVLNNGYRDYSNLDVEKLHKISVLRKLDISTEEIRSILSDATSFSLQAVSVKKELEHQRDMVKNALLQRLCSGEDYEKISIELQSIERGKNITDKLLDAFPGYYSRFICIHFARFLNMPIETESQQAAYETIISFLDNLPDLNIPKEIEDYWIEGTKHISTEQISQMLEATKKSIENVDEFMADNKEVLQQYWEYKQSEEYKDSPACKLMELLKKFNSFSGYNDIFIPAMKQLSPSYAQYHRVIEAANKKLVTQYPEIEGIV